MFKKYKEKFIGDREFYANLIRLIIPMIVQQGITSFVSLLDNVMVGRLGTESMSGVAIVNQLLFVFNLTIFGGLAGASIFGAQFYGKGDHKGVRYALRFKLIFSVLMAVIAIVALLFFNNLRTDGKQNQETVIRFLVTDAPLVKEVIRIIGNVLAVGEIHGRHHDLRAAGFGKCAARALNIAFRRGRKHIRAVIHIARRGIRQRHGKRRHRHKYEHQHRKQHSARLFQNRMYGLCHKHFLSLSVSNFYANSSTSPMPTSFASAYAGELCSASLNAAALSL